MNRLTFIVGILMTVTAGGAASGNAFALTQPLLTVNVSGLAQMTYKLELIEADDGSLSKIHFFNANDTKSEETVEITALQTANPKAMVNIKGQDALWVSFASDFDVAHGGAATIKFRTSLMNHRTGILDILLDNQGGNWVAYRASDKMAFSQVDVRVNLFNSQINPRP